MGTIELRIETVIMSVSARHPVFRRCGSIGESNHAQEISAVSVPSRVLADVA